VKLTVRFEMLAGVDLVSAGSLPRIAVAKRKLNNIKQYTAKEADPEDDVRLGFGLSIVNLSE
jgi:hypothetical protein